MTRAILTDLTRCIGCGACELACAEANGLPLPERSAPAELSATRWTCVERRQLNVRRQCMHCIDPSCVSVCPVAALQKTAQGPVVYDESRCIGCRYCMVACPFNIPKYEWSALVPRVRKCILCYERYVSRGEQPACTRVCPSGATIFGEREGLLREARARLRAQPKRYVAHIYGEREVGGTSVLYLSSLPFSALGFPDALGDDPYPQLTWNVLSRLPQVVTIAGAGLLGIWWIIRRREALAKSPEGAPAQGRAAAAAALATADGAAADGAAAKVRGTSADGASADSASEEEQR